MAYDLETITKAENLYVLEGKSIREVAQELSIPDHKTVFRWSQKHKWEQKRNRVHTKADAKAEIKAIERLAKEKSEYRLENLKLTDLSKSVGSQYLSFLAKLLREHPDKMLDPDTALIYQRAAQSLNHSVKTQDDILFNKNKVEIEGKIQIKADDIYSALLSDDRDAKERLFGIPGSKTAPADH